MAISITHAFTNPKVDGLDTTVVRPSDWNAVHSLAGLGTGVETALAVNVDTDGSVLVRAGGLGTPSSGVATNLTGTATALNIGGNAATATLAATASAVAVGGITGLGTGVGAALAVNVGSAGAPVLFNGAGGTPSSITLTNATGTAASLTAGTVTTNANLTGVITSVGNATSIASQTGTGSKFVVDNGPTLIAPILGTPASGDLSNCTFPTLNQNTTGSAAKWTTARNLAGNSVDGSANVAFANKFIAQGTADTGLSGAQFLGALTTGIVKNTTTTGVLSIAVAGDFPTLNQNTTGSAATLTTARAIYGNNFDGSAALTQIIASTYGGTGNGFVKFSGPATSEKTFTLPNSSETLLYAGGALGTPSSGVLTNCTGTAAGLTAGTVTTNANLTGPITSIGNATSIGAQTGTGNTFVMQNAPSLPNGVTIGTGALQLGVKFAYLTADAALISQTTLQTQSDLTIAIGASETWLFEYVLYFGTTMQTTGLKVAVNTPASAVQDIFVDYSLSKLDVTAGVTPSFAMVQKSTTSGNAFTIAAAGVYGDSCVVRISMRVTTSGAGNVTLQFAQQTSSATSLTLFRGGSVKAVRAA